MMLNMKKFHQIGGLDVEVLSISEYLFRNIEKYKNDEFFFNRALALFNTEYEKYFDNEIEVNQYALDVIANKEAYNEHYEREQYEMEYGSCLNRYNTNVLIRSKTEKENERLEFLSELKGLKNKKYRLMDYIRGIHKKDNNRIMELCGDGIRDGILGEIENDIEKIKKKIKTYEEERVKLQEEIENYEAKIDNVEKNKKTKIHFVDLTVNENSEKLYPYRQMLALDILVRNEEKYKDTIEKMNNYKEIAMEYADYAKKQLTSETQAENVLEEDYLEM